MSTARAVTRSLLQGTDVPNILNRIIFKKEKYSRYKHSGLSYVSYSRTVVGVAKKYAMEHGCLEAIIHVKIIKPAGYQGVGS